MNGTYPSQAAAEASLTADGFTHDGEFWSKPSTVDPMFGGYRTLALCTVQRHQVAPIYAKPDYFTIKFH